MSKKRTDAFFSFRHQRGTALLEYALPLALVVVGAGIVVTMTDINSIFKGYIANSMDAHVGANGKLVTEADKGIVLGATGNGAAGMAGKFVGGNSGGSASGGGPGGGGGGGGLYANGAYYGGPGGGWTGNNGNDNTAGSTNFGKDAMGTLNALMNGQTMDPKVVQSLMGMAASSGKIKELAGVDAKADTNWGDIDPKMKQMIKMESEVWGDGGKYAAGEYTKNGDAAKAYTLEALYHIKTDPASASQYSKYFDTILMSGANSSKLGDQGAAAKMIDELFKTDTNDIFAGIETAAGKEEALQKALADKGIPQSFLDSLLPPGTQLSQFLQAIESGMSFEDFMNTYMSDVESETATAVQGGCLDAGQCTSDRDTKKLIGGMELDQLYNEAYNSGLARATVVPAPETP